MRAKNDYLKKSLFATISFGLPFSIFCGIMFGNLSKGLILGFGGGFLFAIMTTLFVIVMSKKMDKVRLQIERGETILFEGGANHWEGNTSVGGWLFLTEHYLYFVAHKFNFNTKSIKICCFDINKVSKSNKVNSIDVNYGTYQIEKFVVNERKKWIYMIESIIN